MDKINQYIYNNYDGRQDWFIEEVNSVYHWQKVNEVLDLKSYLNGNHKIKNQNPIVWNGEEYSTKGLVIQYAKTIVNFMTNYLLKNEVTLSGQDENSVDVFKKVYKQGKFARQDFDILHQMVKMGFAYEYVYIDENDKIKSKVFLPQDSFPVHDEENKMICFIESFTSDENISYYNVFYPDRVEKWNNEGHELNMVAEYENPSGLPCEYMIPDEEDSIKGRSELKDIIPIIDSMEEILSKGLSSLHKFVNPIPVVSGQRLANQAPPEELVGGALMLDSDASINMITGQTDYQTLDTLYGILKQTLLDVSHSPGITFNSQEVSNLSEVSIKLLFSLADVKAGINQRYMLQGMEQRLEKIERLLKLQGENVDADSVEIYFQYARPMNEADVISNLKTLDEMNAISLETILKNAPYVNDVNSELDKIKNTRYGNE